MNIPTLIAAALMILTIFAHVVGGGPEIHEPIIASELPDAVRAVASVIWHGITTIMVVFAAALIYMAKRPNRPMAILTIAVQLGFAGLFIFYGITRLGTLWPMPQWIIFMLIPAVTYWGQLRKR